MQPLDPAAGALSAEDVEALLAPIMPERNRQEFRERHDTDFAYEIPGLARFRANAFCDRSGPGGVFRVIPTKILTAEQLGLSPAHPAALHAEQGAGARDRADRLGQVDDALRDDRLHQPDAPRPHHHDRRSDRVRAPEPAVPHQPARGADAHRLVQGRAARGAARGSRTSSWSANCGISRRWPSRSRRRKPATSCSARCIRRRPRPPWTA